MTKEEHKRFLETGKLYVQNCELIPHPDIINDPFSPGDFFTQEHGIVKYVYMDDRYFFFKILRNEKRIYWQRRKVGSLVGMGGVCSN